MGLLSSNLKAALRRPGAMPVWLVALSLPGGTRRYAVSGGASATSGLYHGRVLSHGPFGRGVSERTVSLEIYSTSVTIADHDSTFAAILDGAQGNAVRGSTATILLGEESLAQGDWSTVYTGRIDGYEQSAPHIWNLELRPNDLPLQRDSIPKGIITASDWPNAEKDVLGKRYPIIFGKHDSVSSSNQGFVPLYCVDTLSFKYLVGVGVLTVDRVYVDGTPATGWTASTTTVNGRLQTVVTFTASQGDATITADVRGLTTTGTGGGSLITDPPTILKYLLVQFIYGDWKAGAWLADSTAPVDTTAFGTTYYSQRSASGSVWIGAQRTGLAVVTDILTSWEMRAYWTTGGKIAVRVEDPSSFAYGDEPFLRVEDENGWALRYPTSDLVDRIDGEWLADASTGYREALQVRDVSKTEEAPDAVSLPFAPSFVV